jgi:hypothetical protein
VDHIAHNAYVEIGAEMGLPASLIFLEILFSVIKLLDNYMSANFARGGHLIGWQHWACKRPC